MFNRLGNVMANKPFFLNIVPCAPEADLADAFSVMDIWQQE